MSRGDRAADEPTLPGPSALDVLGLDPSLPLGELVEQLGEIASEGDPERAALARQTFERITERPEAHLDVLLATVPRPEAPPRAPSPLPLAPVGASDLSRSLVAAMGPPSDAERRWLEEKR